jgi:beta-carotene 3-hydroxylase
MVSTVEFWIALVCTVGATESVAWFTHRYLLHGPMWFLHRSHHTPQRSFWEWNDLFILVYAVPSAVCVYIGLDSQNVWLTGLGFGIATYGVLYFLVHDVLIHRRVRVWRQPFGWYFRALVRGHKVHHKQLGRDHSRVFGFLWVPVRFYRQAWQQTQR